jgi:hypothetical protein
LAPSTSFAQATMVGLFAERGVPHDLDRFHPASDVIGRLPKLGYLDAYAEAGPAG